MQPHPAVPWADYAQLAELGSLQPLTALGATLPGVATWKPGAFSPLVRVRGTVASAGRLGEIVLVLLQDDGGPKDGKLVGLMLKPRCGLDALRVLVDARCRPVRAPDGRGKLPLREYRRKQRQAAQVQATGADRTSQSEQQETLANDDSGAAGQGQCEVHIEVEAFVEKSKTQFLLRSAPLSCEDSAPGPSGVLPVVLHPAYARWSPVSVARGVAGTGGSGDDDTNFCEWQECGLEPSGSGGEWTATGETHVEAIDLSTTYLTQLRAAKNGKGQGWNAVGDADTAKTAGCTDRTTTRTHNESEDDGRDFIEIMSRGSSDNSEDGIVLSKAARTRQLYNQRKHHRTKAKKCRFAEFAKWVTSTFPEEVLHAGRGCLDVAGGKGSLAYELAVNGTHVIGTTAWQYHRPPIECTVVDTHPVVFSQFRTKEFLHLCGNLASSPDSLRELERRLPAGVVAVRAARRKQNGSLVSWLDPRIAADESRASQLEDCRQAELFFPLYQVKTLFDDAFLQAGSDTAALFHQCGFVLGLHPDQATEPIVDACLAADKAFAVVPCCVFPDENPERKVRQSKKRRRRPYENRRAETADGKIASAEGTSTGRTGASDAASAGCVEATDEDGIDSDWEMVPVRSIEQFVQYLVAKDPTRVRTSVLDAVPGRNTIVWYCPGVVSHKASCDESAAEQKASSTAAGARDEKGQATTKVSTVVGALDACPIQTNATHARKRGVGDVL